MIWQWQREKKFLKLTTLFPLAAEDPGNEWSGKSKEPKAWGGSAAESVPMSSPAWGQQFFCTVPIFAIKITYPEHCWTKTESETASFWIQAPGTCCSTNTIHTERQTEHSWIFFRKSQECEHWEGMGHRCLRSWTQGKTGPQNIKSFQSLDLVVNANTVSRFRPALMKRFSPANLELDDTQKAYHFHPRIDLVTRIYLN